jgi:hypothetical protein
VKGNLKFIYVLSVEPFGLKFQDCVIWRRLEKINNQCAILEVACEIGQCLVFLNILNIVSK